MTQTPMATPTELFRWWINDERTGNENPPGAVTRPAGVGDNDDDLPILGTSRQQRGRAKINF